MTQINFEQMTAAVRRIARVHPIGFISEIFSSTIVLSGITGAVKVGDLVKIVGTESSGEVIQTRHGTATVMIEGSTDGLSVSAIAQIRSRPVFAPHDEWIGRVIDPDGRPLDGHPLLPATEARSLHAMPPPAAQRRGLGARVSTGFALFDTLLPIVRGQRLGLFSGSGVGKSTLLGSLAKRVTADVIVIGLVGERGRELRDFVENTMGPEGMARSIIVAATSDRAAQTRRRCPLAATAVAEYFRDQGKHVLLLMDSVTRFAEAHRETAVAAGETATLQGHPATTPAAIASLCERAGPGMDAQGDITAIYTVLVSGSDMDEPVADMLRGVLDGHIVLDRTIAERGRFPAVDVTRSVSRSLPQAATAAENKLIGQARRLIGAYDQAELMIQAGLYAAGSDETIDAAIACRAALEDFVSQNGQQGIPGSFHYLQKALSHAGLSN